MEVAGGAPRPHKRASGMQDAVSMQRSRLAPGPAAAFTSNAVHVQRIFGCRIGVKQHMQACPHTHTRPWSHAHHTGKPACRPAAVTQHRLGGRCSNSRRQAQRREGSSQYPESPALQEQYPLLVLSSHHDTHAHLCPASNLGHIS